MSPIGETNTFFRAQIELPPGMKLSLKEFCTGWNLVGNNDARLLENKILRRGWRYIRDVDGWMRSGVGDTLQAAISTALSLALRGANLHFNAMEVGHIEWTQYPWFFLARVNVDPYRIQHGPLISVPDEVFAPMTTSGSRELSPSGAGLFPNFTSAMPALKKMLVLSRSSQPTIQGQSSKLC